LLPKNHLENGDEGDRTLNPRLAKRGAVRKAEMMRLSAELIPLGKRVYSGRRLSNKEHARLRAIQNRVGELSGKVDSRWIVRIDPELAIPAGLAGLGRKAAEIIVELLGEAGWTYSGSGSIFDKSTDDRFGERHKAAVLVEARLSDELLDEMFCIRESENKLDERLKQRLEQIDTWWDLNDESTAVIHHIDYPGFSIGLG
jgi:hypothetical protein